MDIASVSQPGLVLSAVPETSPNWLVENQELIRTVKQINAPELFGEGSELTFARDQETRRPVVRVIDRRTNQVVMQLPPDYVLHLASALRDAPGLARPAQVPADSADKDQ